jgi:hypothetical protein
MDQVEPFNDINLSKFLEDGCEFSKRLIAYGKEINYEQLSNLASDLQETFVKSMYLNSLK